ncbi:hypothetical protein OS11_40160 [Dickeya oryzae]
MADTTLDSLEEPQKPDTVANTATPHTSGHPASTDPWAAASSPADASSAGNTPAPDTSADPWNTAPPPAASDVHQNASDWLNTPAPVQEHINLMDPFQHTWIPLDRWVTEGINWLVLHFRPLFQGIRVPVDVILTGFQQLLTSVPAPIAILVFSLLAWQIASFGMGGSDTAVAHRHRRYWCLVAGDGDAGTGTDRLVLLRHHRVTTGYLAGAQRESDSCCSAPAGCDADHTRVRLSGTDSDAVWHW